MEGNRLEPEGSENSVCETFSEPSKKSKSEESWKRYETLDNVTLPPLPDFVITSSKNETDDVFSNFSEKTRSSRAQSNVIRRSVSTFHVDNDRLSVQESEPPSRSLSCSQLNKSSSGYSNKYAHVQSRVKQYIKNVKAKDLKAKNAKLALSTLSFQSATDVTRSTLCWSSDEEVLSDHEDLETKLQKVIIEKKEKEKLLKDLHVSYQDLLMKHSEAEITIDRLRIQCGFGLLNRKSSTSKEDTVDFSGTNLAYNNKTQLHNSISNHSTNRKITLEKTPPQESSSLSTWTSKESNALHIKSKSIHTSAKSNSSLRTNVPNIRISPVRVATVSVSTQTTCDKVRMSVSTQTGVDSKMCSGRDKLQNTPKRKRMSERQKQILEVFDQLNNQTKGIENSTAEMRDQILLLKQRTFSLGH